MKRPALALQLFGEAGVQVGYKLVQQRDLGAAALVSPATRQRRAVPVGPDGGHRVILG